MRAKEIALGVFFGMLYSLFGAFILSAGTAGTNFQTPTVARYFTAVAFVVMGTIIGIAIARTDE